MALLTVPRAVNGCFFFLCGCFVFGSSGFFTLTKSKVSTFVTASKPSTGAALERRGIVVGREGDSDNIMDAVAAMAMASVGKQWRKGGKNENDNKE